MPHEVGERYRFYRETGAQAIKSIEFEGHRVYSGRVKMPGATLADGVLPGQFLPGQFFGATI